MIKRAFYKNRTKNTLKKTGRQAIQRPVLFFSICRLSINFSNSFSNLNIMSKDIGYKSAKKAAIYFLKEKRAAKGG